ncbi:pyrroline-5-carboxylate reductase [Cognatishimia sp. WU-CL00825]|uniref:pyrroline-5-carboxylate reductase n=1 Tax=Cognatishimia sp. WU-CL00825 TaxID=3127658 RepID=UPI00310B8D1C
MNVGDNGVLLFGCGKMGSALLRGWLDAGLPCDQVTVMDPRPSDWLLGLQDMGVTLNQLPANAPSVAVIATKPQIMSEAIPDVKAYGNGATLFISIAAGTLIETFETLLGAETPIVRAMPNTPAAVGKGITVLVPNGNVLASQLNAAEMIFATVGDTVLLQDEEQLHAVTALSGSGPAYVFAMTEALIAAGIGLGLSTDISNRLATSTVTGAGALMKELNEHPSHLRETVTSPNGTTAAGLEVLLAQGNGLAEMFKRCLSAAAERSRELG